MTETHRINSQLKRAQEGQAWHGPSLRELLDGVTAEQAAAKPIPNAHSIWELVNHIVAWEQIARRRLEGEEETEIPYEVNFPPVTDASEAAWHATMQSLEASHRGLRDGVKKIDDAKLEETAPGTRYSNYVLLHGVIQHDLYHAGQIALSEKGHAVKAAGSIAPSGVASASEAECDSDADLQIMGGTLQAADASPAEANDRIAYVKAECDRP